MIIKDTFDCENPLFQRLNQVLRPSLQTLSRPHHDDSGHTFHPRAVAATLIMRVS